MPPTAPKQDYALVWGLYGWAARTGGDEAAYRRVCADLLRRFGDTKDPTLANPVAWVCSLAPGGVPDPGVLRRLAELAVAKNAKDPSWQGTLGLALYRCGKYKEAITHLEEAVRLTEPAKTTSALLDEAVRGPRGAVEDRFVLALAHARLGHKKEAEGWLHKGIATISAKEKSRREAWSWAPRLGWHERLQWRLLRQEAEAAIKSAKP